MTVTPKTGWTNKLSLTKKKINKYKNQNCIHSQKQEQHLFGGPSSTEQTHNAQNRVVFVRGFYEMYQIQIQTEFQLFYSIGCQTGKSCKLSTEE